MVADLPENYENNLAPFQFIKDVPTDWEITRALQGEVGQYVVIARKEKKHRQYTGNDWYIGAITNQDEREISISLDFLDAQASYEAQVYRDGDKADFRTNPYDIVIEKKQVKRGDKLTLKLAGAGGAAVRLKKL